MRSLGLGNWHTLLLRDRRGAALDVGCGFGSLALGLGEYYQFAAGVDALSERVRYGSLRAREDHRSGNSFVQGTGLSLPFRDHSFDLVTLNGVLEWAGFHAEGDPGALQRAMIAEAKRVVNERGTVAIAIENRFAMETLMGMEDTHTGERLVPALPRALADMVMRWRRHKPFRTYLYSRNGYARLMRSAGFPDVRVLDLVSSYNDYDFVVTPSDTTSYRLLWKRELVHTFYRRAGSARRLASRMAPRVLGQTGYAYLILAGASTQTLLDATHPFWADASSRGINPGTFRFACNDSRVGAMSVVSHDGERITGLISLQPSGNADIEGNDAALANIPRQLATAANFVERSTWTAGGVIVHAFEASDR
jgi:ubiquinone/menaquinone biosynthesis C-methylase UbiE